jgi:hypothetical protein
MRFVDRGPGQVPDNYPVLLGMNHQRGSRSASWPSAAAPWPWKFRVPTIPTSMVGDLRVRAVLTARDIPPKAGVSEQSLHQVIMMFLIAVRRFLFLGSQCLAAGDPAGRIR